MIFHNSYYLLYSLERNGKNSRSNLIATVCMYVIFLLHISTVTSMRRARYAREDLRSYSYVDEGPIDYSWSGSNGYFTHAPHTCLSTYVNAR